MKLTPEKIEEFKKFIVSSMNDDVHCLLIDWLTYQNVSDDDIEKAIDFFVDNLHGSLQWID